MRLGQLAREYHLPLQKVISYLNEVAAKSEPIHSNSLVDEHIKTLLSEQFELKKDSSVPVVEEKNEIATVETVAKSIDLEVRAPEDDIDESPKGLIDASPQPKDEGGKSISTDKLMELAESEETDVDLSNITLIKAPKKELSGLKVVGKMELEDKEIPKEEVKKAPEEKDIEAESTNNQRRRLVSDEELEERRLKAKKKKEDNEARQKKLKEERIKKEKKILKEAHYQGKLRKSKPKGVKTKAKIQNLEKLVEITEAPPIPKTRMGKFLRWLNT